MSKYFFSASTAGWVNTFPNTPVVFADLNVENLLMAFVTTWVNPETNTSTECFQVEMVEGGGQAASLQRTTYLFPTYGCTLAQFKTILNAEATDINLTTEIYTNMFAIGNVENVLKVTRDVLINDSKLVRRVYNIPSDYTTLYLQGLSNLGYLQVFVEQNQGSAFAYYYAY